jgi:hypothetical protein
MGILLSSRGVVAARILHHPDGRRTRTTAADPQRRTLRPGRSMSGHLAQGGLRARGVGQAGRFQAWCADTQLFSERMRPSTASRRAWTLAPGDRDRFPHTRPTDPVLAGQCGRAEADGRWQCSPRCLRDGRRRRLQRQHLDPAAGGWIGRRAADRADFQPGHVRDVAQDPDERVSWSAAGGGGRVFKVGARCSASGHDRGPRVGNVIVLDPAATPMSVATAAPTPTASPGLAICAVGA